MTHCEVLCDCHHTIFILIGKILWHWDSTMSYFFQVLKSTWLLFWKKKNADDIISWPFCKLGVSNHGRDISCQSLMALLLSLVSGKILEGRGTFVSKYWHSGRSEAQEPRRKKGGIMLVSWSQATLHSSMLPLLPLTDINTRNQLNLLGCYPRDFGGGGNQSIWRQGKRKGQSAMKESKLQLQLLWCFVSVFKPKTMLSSLVFIVDIFIIQERFPSFFFHMMVIWRLTFLSGCWWETTKQLRTGIFRERPGSEAILVFPAAVD